MKRGLNGAVFDGLSNRMEVSVGMCGFAGEPSKTCQSALAASSEDTSESDGVVPWIVVATFG